MPTTSPVVADTARRLEWHFLPPDLRALIEDRCGSPVVTAHSRTRGFTPGFASVLECEDGSRHFVKAASVRAQRIFAEAYREEARKLAALPDGLPAPRLLWVHDDEWVALETEYVEGRHPLRPWQRADLDACLDALETVARVTTPAPESLGLDTAEAELADFPALWDLLREQTPSAAVDEAAALAGRYTEVVGGDTLFHTDVRDDNALIDGDGRAWFCDWNWPVVGADWLDSLFLLIAARGDGLDVEQVISERALLREVPAESIDVVLALLTGYFLTKAQDPVPPTSPYLRQHQLWQGEVCWEWLCDRRGWSAPR